MFIQIPQVVDDGDIPVAVYQLVASERLPVSLTPRLQVIFQRCDVVEQQRHSVRCCSRIGAIGEVNRGDELISDTLGFGLYRGQLFRDPHFSEARIQLGQLLLDVHDRA